jgi:tRNA uridine 5-carboxymethylaminomethyl modification enzyme
VPGLAFAGQLLGTSGYEEAAVLGFAAGVNAVLAGRGGAPFRPAREESYIGVLIDDLVTRDHREPYRMFTSRAEHRLVLGVDSARERLMADGVDLGLVPEAMFHVEHARWEGRRRAHEQLVSSRLNPDRETREEVLTVAGVELKTPTSWAGLLRRQDIDARKVAARLHLFADLNAEDRAVVIGRLRYDGYLARHQREIERVQRLRHLEIPPDLDPAAIPGLSREVVDQLRRHRPRTLADAERLPGLTPAAVAILAGRLAHGMSGR